MERVLGDSGGVVNSLDFCPASLKSIGCFYFRGTMEGGDSEFANFTLPTLKAFFVVVWPVVIMCLAISNNLLLVL